MGVASADFGTFDASMTDKCTGNPKEDGIRKMVEEEFMRLRGPRADEMEPLRQNKTRLP